jgi:undecaprenyl-diphosphatase
MQTAQAVDDAIVAWFHAQHQPWLDSLMLGITHAGDAEVLVELALLAALGLVLARSMRSALCVLLIAGLAFGLTWGLKEVFHRPRPDAAFTLRAPRTSYSFPSGHSLQSAAIYGVIGLALARLARQRLARQALTLAALAPPLLIGVSRVYLGEHYLSDVLAGWAIGLGLVILFARLQLAPVT